MTRLTAKIPTVLAVLGALLLPACVQQPKRPPAPEPFVFRTLNLRQQNASGQPTWQVTSPEARYDINRRLAEARQPRGTVFRDGKPHITISARQGTVIADGQSIQLEGNVVITLLGRNPVRISGDRASWLPRRDLMLIDRRPQASDRRTRISAGSARYLLAQDRLELRGGTLLEQWQQAATSPAAPPRPATIRVRTDAVDWKPEQGSLLAPGPVRGERQGGTTRPAADTTSPASGDLRLQATGLQGNLRAGFIDLLAPVRWSDRSGSTWLNTQRTRWSINDQWLASDQPFEGARRNLQVRGNALRIDLRAQALTIPGGCSLAQPADQLKAERCSWHWPSGAFQASGGVELRRRDLQQVTRASQLTGRIGADGEAVFRSPGGRVQSQIRLPADASAAGGRRSTRPPVTF